MTSTITTPNWADLRQVFADRSGIGPGRSRPIQAWLAVAVTYHRMVHHEGLASPGQEMARRFGGSTSTWNSRINTVVELGLLTRDRSGDHRAAKQLTSYAADLRDRLRRQEPS